MITISHLTNKFEQKDVTVIVCLLMHQLVPLSQQQDVGGRDVAADQGCICYLVSPASVTFCLENDKLFGISLLLSHIKYSINTLLFFCFAIFLT